MKTKRRHLLIPKDSRDVWCKNCRQSRLILKDRDMSEECPKCGWRTVEYTPHTWMIHIEAWVYVPKHVRPKSEFDPTDEETDALHKFADDMKDKTEWLLGEELGGLPMVGHVEAEHDHIAHETYPGHRNPYKFVRKRKE